MFPILRLKVRKRFTFSFLRGLTDQTNMRILNVAEKNDAAKNIAALLSGGTAIKKESRSVYNKIYEFDYEVFGRNCKMIMTSVSGHLLDLDFVHQYRGWKNCDPLLLFEAPVMESVLSGNENIKKTLEEQIRTCSKLIIWTDCDREGENIGFEIISVCKLFKKNLEIYRAKFSEINLESVQRALYNLGPPDEHISNAVKVRRELDLRIGAAFTRFQTIFLNKTFPNALQEIVSYGSCQFPTLGFVVERFKAISDFKPESFWLINVQHTINKLTVEFNWKRNRLFDKLACEVLYEKCVESGTAKVENVVSKPQSKWRPKPLDTVTLQKLASKKFNISAKEVLKIAENLYIKGLISYPRTETNFFSKEINLTELVRCQTEDSQWGEFAQKVLNDGPNPFQGKKTDEAHSPIHPIKYTNTLSGNEKKIYEFIVRHFLACLSKHAEGLQTTIDIDVAGEKFSAKGLMIIAKNYLEVYPYEKWNDKEIHIYRVGEIFKPELSMAEGETSPPSLLTEADLIELMEKHGIGTDSTHADHIETIKARLYVGLQDGKYFVPRTLGMGLVEGYNSMGHGMAKPELRAELEADLKRICNRERTPAEVLEMHIGKYRALYQDVQKKMRHLSEAIQSYIEVEPAPTPVQLEFFTQNAFEPVGKCATCHSDLLLLKKKKDNKKYIGCSTYPKCSVAMWFPAFVLDVTVTENFCPSCAPNTRLLQFKFKKNSCPYPQDHIGCIGGCDEDLLKVLNAKAVNIKINKGSVRDLPAQSTPSSADGVEDSGFVSLNDISPSEFSSNSSSPKCHCGTPAVSHTVKKSGPNWGKEFYKCGSLGNTSQCDFFQWKDETSWRKKKDNSRNVEADCGDMRCYCSLPCRRLTSTKEGPNKGKPFFICGKPYQDPQKCNFFKWVDNTENINIDIINQKTGGGRDERTWAPGSGARNKKNKGWTLWRLSIMVSGKVNGIMSLSLLHRVINPNYITLAVHSSHPIIQSGHDRRLGSRLLRKRFLSQL